VLKYYIAQAVANYVFKVDILYNQMSPLMSLKRWGKSPRLKNSDILLNLEDLNYLPEQEKKTTET